MTELLKTREKELFLNSAERKPHFGIRKLTIGAASVLLSTTLFMGAKTNVAKADTIDDSSNNDPNITDTQNGLNKEAEQDVASTQSTQNASSIATTESSTQASNNPQQANASQQTVPQSNAQQVNVSQQTNSQQPAVQSQTNNAQQTTQISASDVTYNTPAATQAQNTPAVANEQSDNNQVASAQNNVQNNVSENSVNQVPYAQNNEQANNDTQYNQNIEQEQSSAETITPINNNYQATINYHDNDVNAINSPESQTASINNQQNTIKLAQDLSNYNVQIPDNNIQLNNNILTVLNPDVTKNITLDLTHKHDIESITKSVTRTIQFKGPKNLVLPKTKVDSLQFNGTKDTDLVTGQSNVTYEKTTKHFTDVKIPQIPGYTAKITTVRGVDVTAQSQNLMYTITYVKNTIKNAITPTNDDSNHKSVTDKVNNDTKSNNITKINFDPTTYLRSQLFTPRTSSQLSALPTSMASKLSLFETNLAAMDDDDDGDDSDYTDDNDSSGDNSGYTDDDDDDDDDLNTWDTGDNEYNSSYDDDDDDDESDNNYNDFNTNNQYIDHNYMTSNSGNKVNPNAPSGPEVYGSNDNVDGPGGTVAIGKQIKWEHLTPTNPIEQKTGTNWINFLAKRVNRHIQFYYLPDDSDDISKATKVPNAYHDDIATFTRDAFVNPETNKPYIFTSWDHSKQLVTFNQIDLNKDFVNVFKANDYAPKFMTVNGKKVNFNDSIISQVVKPNSPDLTVNIYLKKGQAKANIEIRNASRDNTVMETHTLTGAPGAQIQFDSQTSLDKYKKFGYDEISNDLDVGATYPTHMNQTITHYITIQDGHKRVTATDQDPYPKNPSPNGTKKTMPKLTKTIERHIIYVVDGNDPNKPQAPKDVIQKVQYHRSADIDLVTGRLLQNDEAGNIVESGGTESKPTPWETDNGNNIMDAVETPTLTGYQAGKEIVPQYAVNEDPNSDKDQIMKIIVHYSPIKETKTIQRQVIPVDENNTPIADGYIPKDQTITLTKEGNNDYKPGKFPGIPKSQLPVVNGYHAVEDVPEDPNALTSKNVNAKYKPNGAIIPVDDKGNEIPKVAHPRFKTNSNDPTKVDPSTPPTIAGYHTTQTVVNPDPNDPSNDVKVKYLPDETKGQVTRVINYVKDDGSIAAEPYPETADVTRDASGKVTTPGYFQERHSPVIEGYYVDPSDATVPGQRATQNENVTVHYHRNGRIIPVDENHNPISNNRPYFNTNHSDPTKTDPHDVPDLSNENYQPKDGISQVQPDPSNPGKDVEVVYIKTAKDATVTRTIHYVYSNGQKAKPDDHQQVNVVEDQFGTVTTSGTYEAMPVKVINGYIADKASIPSDTADSNKEVTVTYSKIGNIVPVDTDDNKIPGANTIPLENDPNDPTKAKDTPVPNVPNYIPTKTTATPDPNDPTADVDVPYNKAEHTGTVQRIIHYQDENHNTLRPDDTQSVNVKMDTNDNIITDPYPGDFASKQAPVITGYITNNSEIPSSEANKNKEYTVIYHKIGNIIPIDSKTNEPIPGIDPKPLENDPNDPTKAKDTPVPDVSNYTPTTPTATPNPNDPTADVKVPYTQNKHDAQVTRTIHFIDINGNKVHDDVQQHVTIQKDHLGNVITPGTYNKYDQIPVITGKIADKSSIPSDVADQDKDVTVTYRPIGNMIPVDQNGNPIPGIDPKPLENNPNDPTKAKDTPVPDVPNYTPTTPTATPNPDDPTADVKVPYTQNEHDTQVTRTIHFLDINGNKVHDDVNQTVTVKADSNGHITKPGTYDEYDQIPVITGKIADKSSIPSDTADQNKDVTVTYKAIGNMIPVDQNGNPIPGIDPKPLENDPNDPTKAKDTPVPDVPNYTPTTPTATPDPDDPTADVKVPYTQNEHDTQVTRTIHFLDINGNKVHDDVNQTVTVKADSNGHITKPGTYDEYDQIPVITGKIADKSSIPSDTADQNKDVTVTYKAIGNMIPVDQNGNPIPGIDPKPLENDPNDPTKAKDTPVPDVPNYTPTTPTATPDPDDPTADVKVPYTQNEHDTQVTRTIHFLDINGNKVHDDVNQTVTVKADSNGHITKPGTYDEYDQIPVITGKIADKSSIPSDTADQNKDVTVTYKAIGNMIPVDQNGNPIPGISKTPYTNDPNDPTKVTTNETVPNVPGYIPDKPTVTPTNPTTDTNVTYHKASDPVEIHFKFIDQDNNNQEIPNSMITETGENGDKHKYSPNNDIQNLINKGYELVSKDTSYDPNGTYSDNEKGHTYTYTFKHHISNVTDGTTKTITQTVTYNVPDGVQKPSDNTQTLTFTRKGTKDDVTNKVTYTNWTPDTQSTTNVHTPVINGYIADKGDVTPNAYTPQDNSKTITVTYKKIGNIVPIDKDGNPIPGAPKVPYKNDPNDASKIIITNVPSIPGYKPSVPSVNPKDPTKDTNVNYEPIVQTKTITRTINYVMPGGKQAHEPTKQTITIKKVGNGPWEPGTYDSVVPPVIKGYTSNIGKVPSDKSTEDKTYTVTYKKVGNIIPRDQNGNPIPGAKSIPYQNDPNDPSKVLPTKVPTIKDYTPSVEIVDPKDPNKDTIVTYKKNDNGLAKITGKDTNYQLPKQTPTKVSANKDNYQLPAQKADHIKARETNYQMPAQKATHISAQPVSKHLASAPVKKPAMPSKPAPAVESLPQTGNKNNNYNLAGIGMLLAGITALGATDKNKHLAKAISNKHNQHKSNANRSNYVQMYQNYDNNKHNLTNNINNANNGSNNRVTLNNTTNSNNKLNTAVLSDQNNSVKNHNLSNTNNSNSSLYSSSNNKAHTLPQTGNNSTDELLAGLGMLATSLSSLAVINPKRKHA